MTYNVFGGTLNPAQSINQVQMDCVTETQQFVFVLCLTIHPNMNSLFDPLFGTDYQIEYEENI